MFCTFALDFKSYSKQNKLLIDCCNSVLSFSCSVNYERKNYRTAWIDGENRHRYCLWTFQRDYSMVQTKHTSLTVTLLLPYLKKIAVLLKWKVSNFLLFSFGFKLDFVYILVILKSFRKFSRKYIKSTPEPTRLDITGVKPICVPFGTHNLCRFVTLLFIYSVRISLDKT